MIGFDWVGLGALRIATRCDDGRVVAWVVGSDSERIELDSSDLAGNLRESAARELCARCGFTFLGQVDHSEAFEALPE